MNFKKSMCVGATLLSLGCGSFSLAQGKASSYQPRVEQKLEQGSVEDAARNLGFAARLPKGSELYVGVQDVNAIIDAFVNGEIGKAIDKVAPEGQKMSQALRQKSFEEFIAIAGEDVFFAGGNGVSDFLTVYTELALEINKAQMSTVLNLLLSELNGDDAQKKMERLSKIPEFLTSKDGAVRLLNKLEIAPLYAGFKVSDKNKRAELLKVLQQAFQMPALDTPEVFKSIKSEKYHSFTGFSVNGKDVVAAASKGGMKEMFSRQIGGDIYEMYEKAISKQGMVCLVGEVDDYIVFFSGKSVDGLKFEESPLESLVANKEADFYRNYSNKKVYGSMYMSKHLLESVSAMNGSLGAYCEMVAQWLAGTDVFGDTREVQELFLLTSKKEKALYDLMPVSRFGLVAYKEDGYKVDMYLGDRYPSLDLDSPRKLAAMAYHADAFISANMIGEEEYSKAVIELLETLFKAVYKGTQIAVEQDFHNADWLEFTEMFKLLDSKIAGDLQSVWEDLKSGMSGLGAESSLMVDLKGRMPRVPKVPSVVLEDGPVPRMAIAYSVLDRSKLSGAWSSIAKAADNLAKTYSKLANHELVLPKPEKMKKAGLDIWSYQLGVTTRDANLALGVSDSLFYMTTSPSYIIDRASEHVDKPVAGGAEFTINMAPLRAAVMEWVNLLNVNGEDFMSEREWEQFKKQKSIIKEMIEASKELEKIDFYTRKVGGQVKSTLHIKTK